MVVIMWGYRVVIPKSLQNVILKDLHASHMGIVKMRSVARSYVYWPGIDLDIERLANSCSSCLLERPSPAKSELHVWHYPSRPWERVHFDYLGPFQGKMYLIILDAHSKWLEVFEAASTATLLAIANLRALFSRFGLPVTCVTDNGPTFTSADFQMFLSENGIKHITSSPYNPQSNGQAGNAVKYVKHKLRSLFREHKNVQIALSRMLFDYRNAVHATTSETPAKLMLGRNLRTRFDLLRLDVSNIVSKNQDKQKFYFRGKNTKYLYINQPVIVKMYRSTNKWVEGIVVKKLSDVMYIVGINSGVLWKRHIDQNVATDTGDVHVNKEAGDIDERMSLEPLADDPSLVSESAVDIQIPAAAPPNPAAVSPRVRPCDVTKPDSTCSIIV